MRLTVLTCALIVLASVPAAPAQDGEAAPAPRASAARLANAAQVRKRLGLAPEYENVRGVESLKVAVLDYGFAGLDTGRRYLPESAVLVEHYDADFVRRFRLGDPDFRKPLDPANAHGRVMAQIVWAVTGSSSKGPRFYLLNANGPTMLRRAVRYAIEQKVDLILFSGAFEGAGNGDGRGPINRVVADALAADIIWVNAAGNYGRRVYNGPVRLDRDGYLRFRDGADATALRFCNRLDENPVTVTLTWNDYRDAEDAGTAKDLDLYVVDRAGKVLASSELRQVAGDRAAGPGESRNPRERVVLGDLPAGPDLVRIRVRAKAGDFTPEDRVRVLVTPARESFVDPETGALDDALTFYDATGKGELYPPADSPLVLTVGDSSPASSSGPTADHRVKPDVILPDSRAFLTDGEVTAGSSNAAAYFAGVVAVLKAAEPGLRTRHLLRLARQDTVRSTSAYTPSRDAAPARGSTSVVVVGPRGRALVVQVSPRAASGGASRPAEVL
ncbi:MAG TPA: S8 family serine peptidase, partial [Gemmataceae bacterium]|nr:S8 family serine peptidase [Gemmataceae bacterium]